MFNRSTMRFLANILGGRFIPNPPDFLPEHGCRIAFDNGWEVSVQWHRMAYAGENTAEVAVFTPEGEMITLDSGDTVAGWQTPTQVAQLAEKVAGK